MHQIAGPDPSLQSQCAKQKLKNPNCTTQKQNQYMPRICNYWGMDHGYGSWGMDRMWARGMDRNLKFWAAANISFVYTVHAPKWNDKYWKWIASAQQWWRPASWKACQYKNIQIASNSRILISISLIMLYSDENKFLEDTEKHLDSVAQAELILEFWVASAVHRKGGWRKVTSYWFTDSECQKHWGFVDNDMDLTPVLQVWNKAIPNLSDV
jgi:hypothetical protein